MIQASEVDGVAVLTLSGDLDARAGADIGVLALDLVMGGRTRLVLDLSGVERIYAAGISALLKLQREANRLGGHLIYCSMRPYIRELLRITMLDRSLVLQADLESALDLSREAS